MNELETIDGDDINYTIPDSNFIDEFNNENEINNTDTLNENNEANNEANNDNRPRVSLRKEDYIKKEGESIPLREITPIHLIEEPLPPSTTVRELEPEHIAQEEIPKEESKPKPKSKTKSKNIKHKAKKLNDNDNKDILFKDIDQKDKSIQELFDTDLDLERTIDSLLINSIMNDKDFANMFFEFMPNSKIIGCEVINHTIYIQRHEFKYNNVNRLESINLNYLKNLLFILNIDGTTIKSFEKHMKDFNFYEGSNSKPIILLNGYLKSLLRISYSTKLNKEHDYLIFDNYAYRDLHNCNKLTTYSFNNDILQFIIAGVSKILYNERENILEDNIVYLTELFGRIECDKNKQFKKYHKRMSLIKGIKHRGFWLMYNSDKGHFDGSLMDHVNYYIDGFDDIHKSGNQLFSISVIALAISLTPSSFKLFSINQICNFGCICSVILWFFATIASCIIIPWTINCINKYYSKSASNDRNYYCYTYLIHIWKRINGDLMKLL